MRIIMINFMETTCPGGINKTITELGKNLSENGDSITVLQPNLMDLPSNESYNGFNIIRIKSLFKNHLYGFCPEFFSFFKNDFNALNPDIIHIQGYQSLLFPEILFLLRLTKLKIPIILTPHYDPLNRGTLIGKLFGNIYDKIFGRFILKRCDHIISISDFEAKSIKNIFSFKNGTVISHGVNKINLKKKKKDNVIKLLYVGYLLDYKGVQHIIRAINVLINSKNIKNVKLTIIGDGKYKENLMDLSKKLKVENYISWKPFLPHDEVMEEMQKHDVFLILSKTEGYGIVVAEALSVGTPSIVTKGTALEEFTKEKGCFGVECPPDPEEVADLIMNIYNDNVEIGSFSNKIRTWDKVAEDYEKIYKELGDNK